MQLSPLQLEDYLLKELRFALTSPLEDIPSSDIRYDPLNIEVGAVTIQHPDDPLRWRSQVMIRSKDENEGEFPYSFEIVYVGFFTVAKEFPQNLVEKMVRANAPALLYSAAREALAHLTSRGRIPGVLIPSVTFIEPVETAKVVQRKSSSTKKPSPSKKK